MSNAKNEKTGILLNLAKKGHYMNEDAAKKLIKYIARGEGSSKEGERDVLCTGAYGAVDFLGEDFTIRQFEDIQHCYTRAGKKFRYADHEIFNFSTDASRILVENPQILPDLAREMAEILSDGQYQVFYGIHKAEKENPGNNIFEDGKEHPTQNLHIHFAVNTVNFHTIKKRQETMAATTKHEKQLQELVAKKLTGQS